MATKYLIRDLYTGDYLAHKMLRGYYLTNDTTQAIKSKTLELAKTQIEKQDIRSINTFTIDAVKFS